MELDSDARVDPAYTNGTQSDKPLCTFWINCKQKATDAEHAKRWRHPDVSDVEALAGDKRICYYTFFKGFGCRKLDNAAHCYNYFHPSAADVATLCMEDEMEMRESKIMEAPQFRGKAICANVFSCRDDTRAHKERCSHPSSDVLKALKVLVGKAGFKLCKHTFSGCRYHTRRPPMGYIEHEETYYHPSVKEIAMIDYSGLAMFPLTNLEHLQKCVTSGHNDRAAITHDDPLRWRGHAYYRDQKLCVFFKTCKTRDDAGHKKTFIHPEPRVVELIEQSSGMIVCSHSLAGCKQLAKKGHEKCVHVTAKDLEEADYAILCGLEDCYVYTPVKKVLRIVGDEEPEAVPSLMHHEPAPVYEVEQHPFIAMDEHLAYDGSYSPVEKVYAAHERSYSGHERSHPAGDAVIFDGKMLCVDFLSCSRVTEPLHAQTYSHPEPRVCHLLEHLAKLQNQLLCIKMSSACPHVCDTQHAFQYFHATLDDIEMCHYSVMLCLWEEQLGEFFETSRKQRQIISGVDKFIGYLRSKRLCWNYIDCHDKREHHCNVFSHVELGVIKVLQRKFQHQAPCNKTFAGCKDIHDPKHRAKFFHPTIQELEKADYIFLAEERRRNEIIDVGQAIKGLKKNKASDDADMRPGEALLGASPYDAKPDPYDGHVLIDDTPVAHVTPYSAVARPAILEAATNLNAAVLEASSRVARLNSRDTRSSEMGSRVAAQRGAMEARSSTMSREPRAGAVSARASDVDERRPITNSVEEREESAVITDEAMNTLKRLASTHPNWGPPVFRFINGEKCEMHLDGRVVRVDMKRQDKTLARWQAAANMLDDMLQAGVIREEELQEEEVEVGWDAPDDESAVEPPTPPQPPQKRPRLAAALTGAQAKNTRGKPRTN